MIKTHDTLQASATKKLMEKFKEFVVGSFFLNEVKMAWNSRTHQQTAEVFTDILGTGEKGASLLAGNVEGGS